MSTKVNNALVIGFLTFFIAAGWAFASPPGSSPDEDAHLTTAWCQSKYESENCIEIPLQVVESGKCFFSMPTLFQHVKIHCQAQTLHLKEY
jgi:hypothetical protein